MSYFDEFHLETPKVNQLVKHIDTWGVTPEDLIVTYRVLTRRLTWLGARAVVKDENKENPTLDMQEATSLEIAILLIQRYQAKRGLIPQKKEVRV